MDCLLCFSKLPFPLVSVLLPMLCRNLHVVLHRPQVAIFSWSWINLSFMRSNWQLICFFRSTITLSICLPLKSVVLDLSVTTIVVIVIRECHPFQTNTITFWWPTAAFYSGNVKAAPNVMIEHCSANRSFKVVTIFYNTIKCIKLGLVNMIHKSIFSTIFMVQTYNRDQAKSSS